MGQHKCISEGSLGLEWIGYMDRTVKPHGQNDEVQLLGALLLQLIALQRIPKAPAHDSDTQIMCNWEGFYFGKDGA